METYRWQDILKKEKSGRAVKSEWTADVYNINFGRNRELMESCQALYQYADFVRMVREYSRECDDLKSAIWKAMNEAIRKNYLDGYFERECFRDNIV